jgi:hydroxyacylglutathione hydrolase
MTQTTQMPPPNDLQAAIIPVTPFQQNTTLLWSKSTMEGVFVDPGGEVPRLLAAAKEVGVKIVAIWLTHGHLDHAGGAQELARTYGVDIIGPHKDDQWLLDDIVAQWAKYGQTSGYENCTPTRYLNDGDTLELSGHIFEVVHCPGHTPGHVAILNRAANIAFVGDLLFKGSIGRTDFPKGNHQQLLDSITGKLWPYGDDMQFVPGHGETGVFGWERKTNPYVSDLALGRA